MKRLSSRDEAILAKMPTGNFTAKDLSLGKEAGGWLASLKNRGLIRKVGMTGKLDRFTLWTRVA